MKKAILSLSILTTMILFAGCESETVPPVEIQSTPNETVSTPEIAPIPNETPIIANDNNEFISMDTAREIALKHAEIDEDTAKFVRVELDFDNGIPEYEVEFYVGDIEYDYEINAITGDIISIDQEIEKTPVSNNTTDISNDTSTITNNEAIVPTTPASNGIITEEDAKSIALKHAGLTESDVTFAKVKLDYDDGIQEYEVEFYVGNKEYDYEINAATGAILSIDQDIETSIPNISNNTNNTNTSNTTITEAEAKSIALKHAGVNESDVTFAKVKLDYDDGIQEYEVEFYVGNNEYDYEINATTGAILSVDHDIETSIPNNSNSSSNTNTSGVISQDEAKTIAFNHAGVMANSNIHGLKIELDYDDGVQEYEIEFNIGNVEYEYEINATTGNIISFDKDIDD